MNDYIMPPEKLYSIIVYDWPTALPGSSNWEGRLNRLWDRLVGRVDSIILTRKSFPAPEWLTSGLFDRLVLPPALVLLLIPIFPFRAHRNPASTRITPT